MIFATCGSSHMPFDRMMEALSALPPDELYVQHGPATPPPRCAWADAYLPFARVVELIGQAEIVVSHGGVGSIMCALRAGHVPVLFPRLRRHSETVDDHQAELAEALAERGTVKVAWTADELVSAIRTAPPRSAERTLQADELGRAVRAAIWGRSASAHPPNPSPDQSLVPLTSLTSAE